MYHSLRFTDRLNTDFLIPSGDAVTISTIEFAREFAGIRATICVLQLVLKGTPMHEPSCGVIPTNSGRLEHDSLDENTNTTN